MAKNITGKNRIPRHKRVKNPPRMKLTARDKVLIYQVYENRFMSRRQLEKLLFPNTSACNRRLMLLYQHRYLDRLYKPVDFGSSQAVYALAKRGADIVAQEFRIERTRIRWSRRQNKVEFLFLEHTLAISEFRVNLELAISKRPDVELLFWKRGTKELNDRVSDPEGKSKYLTVAPDAFFGVQTPDGRSFYFLEMDMGTMSLIRLKSKIHAYRQYWKIGKYTERYGFKSFRVLTVTDSDKRMANLLEMARSCGVRSMFLFATQKLTTSILRDIWFNPQTLSSTSLLN